jgi:tetrapyrrole methylase family protein / MazG family protein
MSAAFDDFVAIIARLRAPDGCQWDRAQTPQTLRRYLLEESYEALEAIDLDDAQKLKEELGDILLQIVLQSQIASETGAFTLDDVIANIHAKIIRRHPHVFGQQQASSLSHGRAEGVSPSAGDQQGATVAQIEENWEQIKRAEKTHGAEVASFLGDIPKGLPALAESEDMQQRAWRVGLWNGAPADAERATFHALSAWHARLDALSLGDALFRLVDRARREGLDAESALRQANQRFAKSLQQSVPAIDAPDTSPPKTQEQTQ